MGARIVLGRLHISCKCGHETIVRNDWESWLKERKKNNGIIVHNCEKCDRHFQGTYDEFKERFFTLDKNGCV